VEVARLGPISNNEGSLMKSYQISTDWIGELAETARVQEIQHRERERRRVQEAQAISDGGQRFWKELMDTVEQDLLRFQREFDDEPGRTLVLEKFDPNGFRVVRPGFPGVKLNVQLHASFRAVEFRYNAVADDESAVLKCSGILDMRVDRNGELYLNQYGRDFSSFSDVSRMLLERVLKGVAFH
jgi:hypothetical protein